MLHFLTKLVLPYYNKSFNSYFYTKVLNDREEDVIFHEGPIKIVASCFNDDIHDEGNQNRTEQVARIVVTLLNTEEDMLVFG